MAIAAIGSAGLAVPQAASARTSTLKDCERSKTMTAWPEVGVAKAPARTETKKKKRYILM